VYHCTWQINECPQPKRKNITENTDLSCKQPRLQMKIQLSFYPVDSLSSVPNMRLKSSYKKSGHRLCPDLDNFFRECAGEMCIFACSIFKHGPDNQHVQMISLSLWVDTRVPFFKKKISKPCCPNILCSYMQATRICWGITFEGNNCSTHDRHNSSSMPSSFHS